MERKRELYREERLSSAVRKHPCLFDKTCKAYKDDEARQLAWRAVAEEMGYSSETNVEAQWINLRTRFTRQRKIFKSFKGEEPRGNFEIYHLLSWLDEFVLSRNHPKHFMNVDAATVKGEKTEDSKYEGLEEFPTMHSKCPDKPSMDVQDMNPIIETESKYEIDTYSPEKVSLVGRKHHMTVNTDSQVKKSKLLSGNNFAKIEERKSLKHQSGSQNSLSEGKPTMQQTNDENDLFGALISSQLRKLTEHHRLQAKHQINNLMFQIQMQQLNSPPQCTEELSHMNHSSFSENGDAGCLCNQHVPYSNASSCYTANPHYVTIIDDQSHNNSAKENPSSSSSRSPTPTCVEYHQGYQFNRQKPDTQ